MFQVTLGTWNTCSKSPGGGGDGDGDGVHRWLIFFGGLAVGGDGDCEKVKNIAILGHTNHMVFDI